MLEGATPRLAEPLPAEPAPVLVLERVAARDEAGPRGVSRGRLSHAHAALGPGAHAILGAPEDGTLALVDVLSGRARPGVGRVRVGGQDPARHAPTRARIGTLGPTPDLPEASSVADAVELALRARGDVSVKAAVVLEKLGLGRLLGRRPGSLSFAEARAVELSLALCTPAPLLVVLFEPFADAAAPLDAAVRERVRALAAEGACVVVITSSPTDARALADHLHLLDRGVLTAAPALSGDARGELWVLVEEPPADPDRGRGVRALAAALAEAAESSGLRAIAWEEATPGASLAALRVGASDPEAAALAVIDAAARAEVTIASITSPALQLRQLRAAPGGAR